jgi:hypothetical protein
MHPMPRARHSGWFVQPIVRCARPYGLYLESKDWKLKHQASRKSISGTCELAGLSRCRRWQCMSREYRHIHEQSEEILLHGSETVAAGLVPV